MFDYNSIIGSLATHLSLYWEKHWATAITWGLVIVVLVVVRSYQKKWREERLSTELALKSNLVAQAPNLTKYHLENLKGQIDVLEDLIQSADVKLTPNSSNVDREVLELIHKMASQKQGRTQNVD